MTPRLLASISAFAISALASSSAWSSPFPDRYDACIRRAANKWWVAGPDWLWWKAQLAQESRLNPDARSPVGAQGLAQFMPKTWDQYAPALGYGAMPPTAACPAAEVGAYYMLQLQKMWSSPRPTMDRHRLAQGSYNAGAGSLLKAQKACGGSSSWEEISACLPQITGRYSAETIGYIKSIAKWRAMMGAP